MSVEDEQRDGKGNTCKTCIHPGEVCGTCNNYDKWKERSEVDSRLGEPNNVKLRKNDGAIPLTMEIYGTELFAGHVYVTRHIQDLIVGLGKQTNLKIGFKIDCDTEKVIRMVLVPEEVVTKGRFCDAHCCECGEHMTEVFAYSRKGMEMASCRMCMNKAMGDIPDEEH